MTWLLCATGAVGWKTALYKLQFHWTLSAQKYQKMPPVRVWSFGRAHQQPLGTVPAGLEKNCFAQKLIFSAVGLGMGHSVRHASTEQETLALLSKFGWRWRLWSGCWREGEGGHRALILWVILELCHLESCLSGAIYSTLNQAKLLKVDGACCSFCSVSDMQTLCKAEVILM